MPAEAQYRSGETQERREKRMKIWWWRECRKRTIKDDSRGQYPGEGDEVRSMKDSRS